MGDLIHVFPLDQSHPIAPAMPRDSSLRRKAGQGDQSVITSHQINHHIIRNIIHFSPSRPIHRPSTPSSPPPPPPVNQSPVNSGSDPKLAAYIVIIILILMDWSKRKEKVKSEIRKNENNQLIIIYSIFIHPARTNRRFPCHAWNQIPHYTLTGSSPHMEVRGVPEDYFC